uniref:Cystatin domain-containing protein n=2 Tax=Canis lupus familiaris TaxID=9615 RepID=A0A8C0M583_CANLF
MTWDGGPPQAPLGLPAQGDHPDPGPVPSPGMNRSRSPMVGTPWAADHVNEEDARQVSNFALTKSNKASEGTAGGAQGVGLHEQVVAGMNYFLGAETGRTRCTKSQPNLDSCPFRDQPHLMKKMLCSYHTYTVPCLGKTSTEKFSGQNAEDPVTGWSTLAPLS